LIETESERTKATGVGVVHGRDISGAMIEIDIVRLRTADALKSIDACVFGSINNERNSNTRRKMRGAS